MNYKYTLDTSSKKFYCPNCHKKRFVRFIDIESKEYLQSMYGRCDRESKCGYFVLPRGNKTITNGLPMVTTKKYSVISDDAIANYCTNYDNNNFVQYLLSHFKEEDVIQAIERYYLGTGYKWWGCVIFWQIDKSFQIRTGKAMLYNANTGKRIKKPKTCITWMHRVIQFQNFNLKQCLFGLHLLNELSIDAKICIVESEKTAVILSILLPNYVWMATGAKVNLKESLLQPLKQYRILVYPDKSEFKDWHNKCITLNKAGYNIKCSSFLEIEGKIEGDDLVDLLL